MKKIILSMLMLTSTIALAQVKVGTDVTNLAANANFQVEGAAPTNQFVVLNNGNVGIGTLTPTASIDIKGSTSDNTAFIEKHFDSDGFLTYSHRNDGQVRYIFHPTKGINQGLSLGKDVNNSANTFYNNPPLLQLFNTEATLGNKITQKFLFTSGEEAIIGAQRLVDNKVSLNFWFRTTLIGGGQEVFSLNENGDVKIPFTPTITTATKVLVKDPATNVISEQVVTGTQVETVSIAATPYQVVTGNTLHNTASTGVILTSPNGSKWLLTVNNDGSFKSTAVTP